MRLYMTMTKPAGQILVVHPELHQPVKYQEKDDKKDLGDKSGGKKNEGGKKSGEDSVEGKQPPDNSNNSKP